MSDLSELKEALNDIKAPKDKKKLQYLTCFTHPEEGWTAEMYYDPVANVTGFYTNKPESSTVKTITYKGETFYPLAANHVLLKFVHFPVGPADYGSEEQLLADIHKFIGKWVDLEPLYLKLCAYYVLLTWCYDEFFQIPYLRILADFDSGKTRLGVNVLGAVCYKSFITSGVTSIPSIFRGIDMTKGTFILDEADLDKKSDKSSEILQMFNVGYLKDAMIFRTEQGKAGGPWSPVAYYVYGPKIIIGRETLGDDATESRCLLINIKQTTRRDIPLLLDKTLDQEAAVLRDKLLKWRLDGYGKRKDNVDHKFVQELTISSRLKQLLIVLSGVISSPEMKEQLKEYATTLQTDNNQRRGESKEGAVIQAMVELYGLHGENWMSAVDVAAKYKELNADEQYPLTSNRICFYFRQKLQLVIGREAGTGRTAVFMTETILKNLCNKYNISFTLPVKNEAADLINKGWGDVVAPPQ